MEQRRHVKDLARMAYCGIGNLHRGMTWHAADVRGRMYRCTCQGQFRLGERLGPRGHYAKGAKIAAVKRRRAPTAPPAR